MLQIELKKKIEKNLMNLNKSSNTLLKYSIYEKQLSTKRNKNKSDYNTLETTNFQISNSEKKNIIFYKTQSKYINLFQINKNLKRRTLSNDNLKNTFFAKNKNNIKEKKVRKVKELNEMRKLRMKIFNVLNKNSISICDKFQHNTSKYNKKIFSYFKGPKYFKHCINSNSKFKLNCSDKENDLLKTISIPKLINEKLPYEILKEKLNDNELKLVWQKPNYFLYNNPYLKCLKVKENKSLLNNFDFEDKIEKTSNIKKFTLDDIIGYTKIDNKIKKNEILKKNIEREKEKINKKILKMKLYKNYNNNQFQIGKRNIPEKLKNEIDNNIKKTLKYSYSQEIIHYNISYEDLYNNSLNHKNLKDYSLLKNKYNIEKGFYNHFKVLEKINKEKEIENHIKSLKEKFIKIYK